MLDGIERHSPIDAWCRVAREISDLVCFLKDGVILEAAPPAMLFTAPERQETAEFLQRVIASGRL